MPRGENRPSVLLTREENEQVFGLIGPKCQSLATTVVQLFTTEGPAHSEWRKRDTGILCLIKDNLRRSYFFRIYCLNRKAMIWQHEVYIQIEYKNPRDYLHTFEAEEYMTAFNFANTDEARHLRNILIEKIELRKQKREERRQRSVLAARANNNNINNNNTATLRHNGGHAPVPPPPATPAPAPPTFQVPISRGKEKNKKGKPVRKLTKHDIGLPQNFKHLSHIGWNADNAFDFDERAMASFFDKVGISETQLQDQDTREFIYDFINTHGGLDAVKEELHDEDSPTKGNFKTTRAPPPVPTRSPAPPHPPGPPSRAPPPPPSRALPPPPLRTPPPPRPLQPPTTAPPSVPPPPPPPPPSECAPPPPPAPPAPPPPPPPSSSPPDASAPPTVAAGDPRSALMESIRSGNKALKKVEAAPKPEPEPSRGDLLSEIRQGIELRSVSKDVTSSAPERRSEACGLAGALQRALQERNRAIHSSDSDLSDETTSDGEWDE